MFRTKPLFSFVKAKLSSAANSSCTRVSVAALATLSATEERWHQDARIYEYGSAANPHMKPIPVLVHPPNLHEAGPTRVIPFDLSSFLAVDDEEPCTSPNLLASFVRILGGESINTQANATSQAFYVIRGSGSSSSEEHGMISWSEGDLFVVPATPGQITHSCSSPDSALYWIHDEPLLRYLGATPTPSQRKFEPTLFKREDMLAHVEEISHQMRGEETNRLGVLLGNAKFDQTKTLTHTLWSLLNSIPADSVQRAHRHNSVALDLCVEAKEGVYTLMGKEIDAKGDIIDPIRCDWTPGGVFTTPPGWWHSHHNESDQVAWVLPMQDAGLYTHQRTLDIRFVDDELALHAQGRIRGSSIELDDEAYGKMVQAGAQVAAEVGSAKSMAMSV